MVTKGEETRERILDRALAMAAVVGLEGLSIGDLARETGMSKSGLFAHFASKEELQLKIIETARERFIRDVVQPAFQATRGESRVRALFDAVRVHFWEPDPADARCFANINTPADWAEFTGTGGAGRC